MVHLAQPGPNAQSGARLGEDARLVIVAALAECIHAAAVTADHDAVGVLQEAMGRLVGNRPM